MSKSAYVRSQGQTRQHHCHWPGCKKNVPPAKWGCREHWFRLPQYLRARIWAAYTPGQEKWLEDSANNPRPSEAYINAAEDVQKWIHDHEYGAGD